MFDLADGNETLFRWLSDARDEAGGFPLKPVATPAAVRQAAARLAPFATYMGKIARLSLGPDGVPIATIPAEHLPRRPTLFPFPKVLLGGDALMFSIYDVRHDGMPGAVVFCVKGDESHRAFRDHGRVRVALRQGGFRNVQGPIKDVLEARLGGGEAEPRRQELCEWFEDMDRGPLPPACDEALLVNDVALACLEGVRLWKRERLRRDWYKKFARAANSFFKDIDALSAAVGAAPDVLAGFPNLHRLISPLLASVRENSSFWEIARQAATSPSLAAAQQETTMSDVYYDGKTAADGLLDDVMLWITVANLIELLKMSDVLTQEGERVVDFLPDYSGLRFFEVEPMDRAAGEDGFWARLGPRMPHGSLAWLAEGGRLALEDDMRVAWDDWEFDEFPEVDEGEIARDLLEEASLCKKGSIPPDANVQFAFGPFTGCTVREFDGRVLLRWHGLIGDWFYGAWPDRRHQEGELLAGMTPESVINIPSLMQLISASIVRDFWVMEDHEVAFEIKRKHGRSGPSGPSGERVVYLPRMAIEGKRPRPENLLDGLRWKERVQHSVRSHRRRAEHPSAKQLALAQAEHQQLDPGFTWVKGHMRGRGETSAPIYRSRSALRLLWGD